MKINHRELTTEKQNPHSMDIDNLSTLDILKLINREDSSIAVAVKKAIPEVEKVVEFAVTALKNGNRIIYIGAGTSGRLGILDASEIPPTFSAPREWFTGVIPEVMKLCSDQLNQRKIFPKMLSVI